MEELREQILSGLNANQREAVVTIEGYVRVSAGAGAGKTGTLAKRFVYLTDCCGVMPENILCITFTRKAADEMKTRIQKESTKGTKGVYVSTYHSFCKKILSEDINRLYSNNKFDLITDSMQERIFNKIYHELKYTKRDGELQEVLKMLSTIKNGSPSVYIPILLETKRPEKHIQIQRIIKIVYDVILKSNPVVEEVDKLNRMATLIAHYLHYQQTETKLDFIDLLEMTLYLFKTNPGVLEKWQKRLHYIMVDEFQDSSEKEMRLLHLLQGEHKNLFIVGDADQAIYGFKGGDVKLFMRFPDIYTPCNKIKLEKNYRSVAEVVQIGNDLIEKNMQRDKKTLHSERGVSHQKIKHYHAKSDEEEMKFVAEEIEHIIKTQDYSYKDIAIIYRSKNSKKGIERALVREAIPYTIVGEKKFYHLKEIKTVIAYLRMVKNVEDNEAFLLTVNQPARKFGEERQNELKMYAELHELSYYDALSKMLANGKFSGSHVQLYIDTIEYLKTLRHGKVSLLMDEMLNKSSYLRTLKTQAKEAPYENVMNLVEGVKELERRFDEELSLTTYLDIVEDFSKDANERYAEEDIDEALVEKMFDQVNLMTIHVSKGLEYPIVFIIQFNDEILPNGRNLNGDQLEEERRLAYVALTRAKDLLYVTESEGSSEDSDKADAGKLPSRFLYEVDRNHFDELTTVPRHIEKNIKDVIGNYGVAENKDFFEVGTYVQHKLNHNYGTIVKVEDECYIVEFENRHGMMRINRQVDCLVRANRQIPPEKKMLSIVLDKPTEEIQQKDTLINLDALEGSSTTDKELVVSPIDAAEMNITTELLIGRHAIFGKAIIISENQDYYQVRFEEIEEERTISKVLNCIMFDEKDKWQ